MQLMKVMPELIILHLPADSPTFSFTCIDVTEMWMDTGFPKPISNEDGAETSTLSSLPLNASNTIVV